jgi:hypothetical protein
MFAALAALSEPVGLLFLRAGGIFVGAMATQAHKIRVFVADKDGRPFERGFAAGACRGGSGAHNG